MYYKGAKTASAPTQNSDLHGHGEEIRNELGKRIPKGRRLKVLDVGTGFGINLAFLAKRLPKGSEIWTVDPSTEVLQEARVVVGDGGPVKVNFVEASAHELDFSERSFDVVVSVMVLHHIEKIGATLRELGRVLKPGGRLVLVDYKPEASHKLEFGSRHDEGDFFTPGEVARRLTRLGMKASWKDFGVWYLVEATKPPRARRGAVPGGGSGR